MAQKKDGILKLGTSLGIISAIAACVLAFTSTLTKDPIARNNMRKNTEAIKSILPPFDNDPLSQEVKIDNVSFFPGYMQGKLLGIAARATTPKGFGGNLTTMLCLKADGEVRNLIVTESNETPGLGTVVTARKEQKTLLQALSGNSQKTAGLPPNKVLDSFNGINCSSAPWKLKKDGGSIDSVTGATISSNAVTDAANRIAKAFKDNREQILAEFAEKEKGTSK